ncbi:ABC transporter ATP-binding protein [Dialister micraerophilus]|uniref:ABC superfamily ATP binding cassette transporter, ABC/membrane protein n=1 Tax=Dialister micraerophilus DSM 19965 TaxID=888062 RepID=F2BY20_9FIRM|nr:ABC transporter ATP-binding protein [Dialister micraerophilus]EGF12581.1 ABC superfamily ATP binding cassette transporter, ABC/membrane protein [Dialister micraerophilus DSM 19965]
MEIYKKMFKYVPEKKWYIVISVICSALSAFLTVGAYYYVYKFLIKLLSLNLQSAWDAGMKVVLLLISGSIVYYISVILSHIFAFRLETNLRKYGINLLSKASFKFFDLYPSGLVRKLIDDNASNTHTAVAHLIPDNARGMFSPLLAIMLGFFIDIKLGVTLLALVGISVFILSKMMGEQKFMEKYQKSLEVLSDETVEYVRGIQVVKIFRTSITTFRSLYEAIMNYSKNAYEYAQSCKIPYTIYNWIFFGLVCIVLPVLFFFEDIVNIDIRILVELLMLFFLTGVIFAAFMKIMYIGMHTFQGSECIRKLEDLYESMEKERMVFGSVSEFKNYNIDFENVTFAYKDRNVIENLSFSLDEGKIYALVGESGSGKTTIAKLISGFYSVNEGVIKIGDIPIQNYSYETLSKNIAFVFQNSKLFKTDIYTNVAIGRKNATRKEVLNALHLASCDSILDKLPNRENTVIGSKGINLSVGEKQRIAIARAILKDAKIIIMDEASASTDPENEYEIQKAFKSLIRGKTVIMIAHRLSAIKNVDEILVMEKGKIIERGSDLSLSKYESKYDAYKKMYGKANEWRLV